MDLVDAMNRRCALALWIAVEVAVAPGLGWAMEPAASASAADAGSPSAMGVGDAAPLDRPDSNPLPPAFGSNAAGPNQVEAPEELSLGWAMVRTALVLGAVVALAYLTLNVGLRRLLGVSTLNRENQLVRVVERIPLDHKRSLYLVKAGAEVLLIGGTDSSLRLLSRLDPGQLGSLPAPLNSPGPSLRLSPFLQKLLGKKGPPPPASS